MLQHSGHMYLALLFLAELLCFTSAGTRSCISPSGTLQTGENVHRLCLRLLAALQVCFTPFQSRLVDKTCTPSVCKADAEPLLLLTALLA